MGDLPSAPRTQPAPKETVFGWLSKCMQEPSFGPREHLLNQIKPAVYLLGDLEQTL